MEILNGPATFQQMVPAGITGLPSKESGLGILSTIVPRALICLTRMVNGLDFFRNLLKNE